MRNGRYRSVVKKLELSSYAEGVLANVCWSPTEEAELRPNTGLHVHSFYEIVYVESGLGSHEVNGNKLVAGPGHLVLLAPGTTHDPRLLAETKLWIMIFNFQALDAQGWAGAVYMADGQGLGPVQQLIRSLHASSAQSLTLDIPPSDRLAISGYLGRIKAETQAHAIGWRQAVEACLQQLLIDILRRGIGDSLLPAGGQNPTVAQAMDFIDRNYKRPIELADIARHVGRSRAFLTTLVRKQTGISVMAWLSDRRLHEARRLILTSRKSLDGIARELGYEGERHFSHMFKRRYGASPMKWRQRVTG